MTQKKPKNWASRVYEENASIYQSILEAGLKAAPAEVRGMVKMFETHGVADRRDILDVACGIGRHSVYLAKAGYRVTGMDPSSTFLARAEELAEEEGASQNVQFVHGRFSTLRKVLAERKLGRFSGIVLMDHRLA